MCGENKGADQLRSNAKLICAFVFSHRQKSSFLTTWLILLWRSMLLKILINRILCVRTLPFQFAV